MNLKIGRLVKLLRENINITLKKISINMAEFNKEKKQNLKRKKQIAGYMRSKIMEEEEKINKITDDQSIQGIISEHVSSEESDDPDNPKIEEVWYKKRRSTDSYLLPNDTILPKIKQTEIPSPNSIEIDNPCDKFMEKEEQIPEKK